MVPEVYQVFWAGMAAGEFINLADPTARYHDLGADYHTRRIDTERRTRSHVRQLEALGYKVTLAAA